MIPFLDDSGPTLFVNTASTLTVKHLTPMLDVLHKRTPADTSEIVTMPTMTASEMYSKGIFQGKFLFICANSNRTHHCQSYYDFVLIALTGIQIRQHRSGQIVLNENHVRTENLMKMVTVFGRDWYEALRSVNRHLFREYVFI